MKLKFKLTLLFAMLMSVSFYAQASYTLTGIVTTSSDNQPLPRVTVRIVNATTGTETDFDGKYSIQVKRGDVLEFSYLGYATQNITINSQRALNVSMSEDASILDEIVVVGYGTQKKSHLTGAISKVKNEKLDQIAVARVDEALVGQVSGVNVQATEGEAGSEPTIRIRGTGSINGNSDPAIVVDGLLVGTDFLGSLDMNEIESFEVLKDAASAAIYGSRGANGVILITTKSGKEGKTKFSYNTFTGLKQARQSDAYYFSVAESAEREILFRESQLIAQGLPVPTDRNSLLSDKTRYKQLIGIDRDWQDIIFDGGTIQSHSFSARGGTENTKFSASLRTLSDEGVVITDDYKLYTGSLKLDTKLNDRLKFGLRATPSYTKQRRLPTSIHNPIRQSPWCHLIVS